MNLIDDDRSARTAASGFLDGFTLGDGLPAVPIVLGVVGHRHLPEHARDRLRDAMTSVLNEFRRTYPQSPIVVLTGLAQGADLLAAEAALNVDGVFVRAPLPFGLEYFRASTSFDDDEAGANARAGFDRVIGQGDRVESFVVPLPPALTADLDRLGPMRVASEKGDDAITALRQACYANVGGYISRHCHLLIAFWDGRPADLASPSGTGEFVAMKLFGEAPSRYPWTDDFPLGYLGDRGPVLAIRTPRTGEQAKPDTSKAGEIRVLAPSPEREELCLPAKRLPLARYITPATRFASRVLQSFAIWGGHDHHDHARHDEIVLSEARQFREICSTIEDYNRDVARPAIAEKIQGRLKQLGNSLRVESFDDEHNRWLERLSRAREAAGAVANHLDRFQFRAQLAILALLALAITFFHLYAHHFDIDPALAHPSHRPGYLWAFAATLVATFTLVSLTWWLQIDQRRIDSRTLAEALRIRLAWSKSGINKSVADSYLRQLRSELSWIRQALLHLSPPPSVWSEQFDRLAIPEQQKLLIEIRDSWVKGQKDYFARRWKQFHFYATLCRALGFVLAVAAWLALCSLLLPSRESAAQSDEPHAPAHAVNAAHHSNAVHPPTWLLIGSGLAILAGGLLIAYTDRRSYEELARQYERMEVVFEHGLTALSNRLGDEPRPHDLNRARDIITELGRECMMEHAQWLLLRRSRPLELQIGG